MGAYMKKSTQEVEVGRTFTISKTSDSIYSLDVLMKENMNPSLDHDRGSSL